MFEQLTSKLENLFFKIKNKGRLSPEDLENALREIKLALLEADVNFKVVKRLLESIKEKAIGEKILDSLSPSQQVIKIVNEEITAILGRGSSDISYAQRPPTIFMIVGLQGSGKTTSVVKLANYIKNKTNKTVGMIAADTYRPAAILQLKDMAESLGMNVYSEEGSNPLTITKNGLERLSDDSDVIIIDTAGRLHVDKEMMGEVKDIKKLSKPHQIFLVLDSMTGQEAVKIAKDFNDQLEFDSIILTKLDSDTRGGAALSVYSIVNKPIKFVSTGEKVEDFDMFYPDRIASRILGMGDVLSLIEKAEKTIDEKEAKKLEDKIYRNELNLEDFILQLKQIKKMGSFDKIIKMLPIRNKNKVFGKIKLDDRHLDKVEAIINSMTVNERRKPHIINGSRKKRIANGSGSSVNDVNRLLKQFAQTKQMMGQMSKMQKDFGLPFESLN